MSSSHSGKGQEGDLLLQCVFSKVALCDASTTVPREHPAFQAQRQALRTDATCSLPSGCPPPECQVGGRVWGGDREDLTRRSALIGVLKGEEERIR